MQQTPKFQFSLRTFLLACLIAGLLTSFAVSRYLAHDHWLRSIRQNYINSGFQGFNGTQDRVDIESFYDQKGRLVSSAFLVYDAFDPNIPAITKKLRFSYWQGGILEVDGRQVNPLSGPTLFVNGAYGHTARIPMSAADVNALENARRQSTKSLPRLLAHWRTEIEPRLYKLTGQYSGDKRDGKWTYHLWDGRLYLEAEYKGGERHGEWISHYPDGAVQCRRHFSLGNPVGRWEYFSPAGASLGSIEWDGMYVRDFTPRDQRFARHPGWIVTTPSGNQTGYLLDLSTHPGKFLVESVEMPRPPITFPLHQLDPN
jgi:hypothetical protein